MSVHRESAHARRAAIRLLHWYPRPWRARYQREMQALLEEMPVGWRQAGNLAAAGVREWLSPRAFGWPARVAAGRILARRNLMFAAYAYLLDGIARITAAQVTAAGVTVRASLEDDLAWLLGAMLIRVVVAGTCRTRIITRSRFSGLVDRHEWLRYIGDWEIALWLVVMIPGQVVQYVLPAPAWMGRTSVALEPYMEVYKVWMWTYLLVMNSRRSIRLRKIYLGSFKLRARLTTQ